MIMQLELDATPSREGERAPYLNFEVLASGKLEVFVTQEGDDGHDHSAFATFSDAPGTLAAIQAWIEQLTPETNEEMT